MRDYKALKEELEKMDKDQILEYLDNSIAYVNYPKKKTKEQLIRSIINDLKFKDFWIDYYE